MKQKLIFELRHIVLKKNVTFPVFALSALAGIFTWFGCDKLTLFWCVPRTPSVALPLPLMFSLWMLAVLVYSVMIAACTSFFTLGRATLRGALSYVLFLFWLPLNFPGRAGIAALCALLLSAVFLFCSAREAAAECSLVPLSAILLAVWLVYCASLTIAYAII